jgi:outer membrane protein OmpA-like peptidoglycan-associated protein
MRPDTRRTRSAHHPHHPRRTAPFVGALTAAVTTAALLGSAAMPASASTDDGYDWPGIEALELGEPAQEQLVESVTEYVVAGSVIQYVTEGSVDSVDDTTQDGGETVVTLSSDILFDTDDASLSNGAKAKIATLVAEVPNGATMKVYGHTDSVDSDAHNQKLSDRRAEAVAAAVRSARSDLRLDVRGFGETQLEKPETGDEESMAQARAENRRVEIRYGG